MHPSYKAGAAFGRKLENAAGVIDPEGVIHSAAVSHMKRTKASTLADKLSVQQHFKAGVSSQFQTTQEVK